MEGVLIGNKTIKMPLSVGSLWDDALFIVKVLFFISIFFISRNLHFYRLDGLKRFKSLINYFDFLASTHLMLYFYYNYLIFK